MKILNQRWMECSMIIAVVAFALALLFPMTTTARSGGKSALCLTNLHLLGRAWTAYHEDNDSWLVGLSNYTTGLSPADEYKATHGTPYRWVESPLYTPVYGGAPVSQQDCNLTTQLNGVRAGKLFAYTQNEQVYHCPNDRYWLTKSYGPWISYSGSGCMNGEDFTSRNGMNITGFRTVTLPSGQAKQLVCVNKFSQIKSPASRFTFIEEDFVIHNQWRYAGGFVTMANSNYWSWWDWPAWYHNGSSTLGFADGHAEVHRWMDQRTILLTKNGTGSGGASEVQPDNPDLIYINNGYVPAGW
jgi:prepilin-type processing-associated H-X9-DG protein